MSFYFKFYWFNSDLIGHWRSIIIGISNVLILRTVCWGRGDISSGPLYRLRGRSATKKRSKTCEAKKILLWYYHIPDIGVDDYYHLYFDDNVYDKLNPPTFIRLKKYYYSDCSHTRARYLNANFLPTNLLQQ